MNVLFISSGNSSYGIVPFIKVQGESLIENGINLEFYTVKGKGVSGYLKNLKNIRKISKNHDIIHAHYGFIGLLVFIAFTGKPVVLSVMGSDAYGNFDKNGRRKTASYLGMFLTQLAILFSKAIIVKSVNLFKYIPFKNKTFIIPNGVNFTKFKTLNANSCKDELQVDKNKKNILYLADPKNPRKNYKLIQDAMKLVETSNVSLINPYPIKHKDFVKYINASDVFVLTSFNEGSPNVIKEAMACNCPIVSTDVGDVENVIKNTKGCFISSFDPKDFAANIDKALLFNKRTTGRADIQHLDSNVIAKRIIDIYKTLL